MRYLPSIEHALIDDLIVLTTSYCVLSLNIII